MDLKHWVNPGITRLKPYEPGKPIAEVRRELGLEKVIKLASNENPLGCSPHVIQAIQTQLLEMNRYPDGAAFELKAALASYYKLTPSQFIIGNGSENVLAIIAHTFVTPGETIIIPEYSFATLMIIAHEVNAKPLVIPNSGWHVDSDALINAVDETCKMIFLANPNNPTGCWITHTELKTLLTRIPKHVFVVLDEAYYEFMDDPDYPDAIQLQREFPNLIITRTFSKAYGLAGLRVGYCIADDAIGEYLERTRLPFNVSSLAQCAAIKALNDQAFVADYMRLNQYGRTQMQNALSAMGFEIIAAVANFVTFDCKQPARQLFQALLKEGVIVRPLDAYGLDTLIRVSIGTPPENECFLAALKKLLFY